MQNSEPVRHHSFSEVLHSWRHWWHNAVVGSVDQAAVTARRREECRLSARYLFMLAMSAGIAVLGLLLSSPAVVIGAMLLSPLMDPIMGLGFAIATGDFRWMRQSAKSLALGTLLAVALTALIVALSPLQTVTSEIAARTRPNLFDLLVALFSALAGAYAMIRGREGTIVGVAIATALMPPLAVVGFGLATFNWTVFSGALMLYVTNLLAIALTAAVMARLYGFSTSLSDRQTNLQTFVIVVVFLALAIPLGFSLRQIAWEARASRVMKGTVLDAFDGRARVSQIEIGWDSKPISLTATVLTPLLRPDAEKTAARALKRELGRAVDVSITQYKVGTSAQAAEEAQLAAAQAQKAAADLQRSEELAARLALVAGVDESQVVIDRDSRRALVTAKPLDGATLAAYRELERRIGATVPQWRIELRPPARPLPDIAFADGKPTDDGQQALDLIQWAALRVQAPVVLTGSGDELDDAVSALEKAGVMVKTRRGRAGRVSAAWGAIDQ